MDNRLCHIPLWAHLHMLRRRRTQPEDDFNLTAEIEYPTQGTNYSPNGSSVNMLQCGPCSELKAICVGITWIEPTKSWA